VIEMLARCTARASIHALAVLADTRSLFAMTSAPFAHAYVRQSEFSPMARAFNLPLAWQRKESTWQLMTANLAMVFRIVIPSPVRPAPIRLAQAWVR